MELKVEGRGSTFTKESDRQPFGLLPCRSAIDQSKSDFLLLRFHSQFSLSLTVSRRQDRIGLPRIYLTAPQQVGDQGETCSAAIGEIERFRQEGAAILADNAK